MILTMSSLPRYMNCPGSASLPRAETASRWAAAGNAEHDDLAVLGDLPPELAKYVPAGARSEVKIVYDVANRTSRITGEGAGRGYGNLGPFDIPGSIDVLGVDGDSVVIVDWKTGYNLVESAATNPQLWGYALAAAKALGRDQAIVRIVYTKLSKVDEYAIDALELAAFADRLEQLHIRVAAQRGPVDTVEGPWCRYCPSKAHCPSKNALLVQVAAQGLAVVGDAEMNPMRAAAGYREIVRLETLVKEARGRLEAYVDSVGPIDLGGGRMFGRYSRLGKSKLDTAVATKAIREIVGESAKEFESIAFERSTSQAAIGRAAKELRAKGHTTLQKQIVDRIEALGGKKQGVEYPLGEFDAGKHAAVDVEELNRLLSEVPDHV